MKTTFGTSHFVSLAAAVRYYRAYSTNAAAVRLKIKEGAIHIGTPELKPGQTLSVNVDEGRYFIMESEVAA